MPNSDPRGARRHAKRIEICGGIATGKTTLAHTLAGNGRTIVLENFRDNPFWKRFYERPDLFAPEKNVCFLAQHTGEIKAAGDSSLVVCDYAVLQDLAYASLHSREHLSAMEQLHKHLYSQLPSPTLLVHLVCDIDEQMERIRVRARAEERSITPDYLVALNSMTQHFLNTMGHEVARHTIRSDQINFSQDSADTVALKEQLLRLVTENPPNS